MGAVVLIITKDNYFRKNTPSKTDEITNYVEVETQPLTEGNTAEIYRSNDPIAVGTGLTVNLTITYNSSPCINAVGSLQGATNTIISAATYYAWGAVISLTNSGGSTENVTLIINGKALSSTNKIKIVSQDSTSITEYGKLKYTFPVNPLMQGSDMAQAIADTILAAFKDARRDLTLEWRGNPALVLGDKATVDDADYNIIRQELQYDGTLRAITTGRRS